MFKVLFLMLALLVGLVGGPYISGKQGYVLIDTGSYTIELSITTLIIFFVFAMALVYVLEWIIHKFLTMSQNTYSFFSRRKRAKAQQQTLEGLMKMNEGDYSKAEKLIGKNAKHSAEPILNFIKAAEAAQQQGDDFSANRYLIEATEIAGSDNLLVELARTRILLQQQKLPAARSNIDSVLEMAGNNVEALKLAVEIYLRSQAYLALDEILPAIEKANIYSEKEFAELKERAQTGLLDEIMHEDGADGLNAWWNEQSRKRHNDNELRLALIERLVQCNDQETAYELTLETLKKAENNTALSQKLYQLSAQIQVADSQKLIKLLEKRLKNTQADNCEKYQLHKALAYLYVREDELKTAAPHFRVLMNLDYELEPNDATMAIYVFDKIGDMDSVKAVRNQRLQTAMTATKVGSNKAQKIETAELPQLEVKE